MFYMQIAEFVIMPIITGVMKIWKLNKNKQEIEQLYISIDNLLQNNGKTSQNILSVFTYYKYVLTIK